MGRASISFDLNDISRLGPRAREQIAAKLAVTMVEAQKMQEARTKYGAKKTVVESSGGKSMSEMTMEREGRILERAVEKYGAASQTDMMIEEASELIKALCKHRRAVSGGASGVEISCKCEDVLEELADVQIMLNQMMLIYGDCTEQEIAKLERLEMRLGMEAET